MLEASATKLVALLRGPVLRHRSGILLLPSVWLGREGEVAARLGVSNEDYRATALRGLAPDQSYLGLEWRQLIERDIDGLMQKPNPDGGCVLVANLDLPLCSFPMDDRNQFWRFMRESHRPAWGLLLALPNVTSRLMSEDERKEWERAERLAAWEGG